MLFMEVSLLKLVHSMLHSPERRLGRSNNQYIQGKIQVALVMSRGAQY